KANWSDTEALVQALARLGFEIVPFDAAADAYVVNTCTVTGYAGAQSRQMLRRAQRRAPSARIVATGCLGEVLRDKLAGIEGIDAVFGVHDRERLAEYLCRELGVAFDLSLLAAGSIGLLPADPQSRARAFVKIQEGCNRRCSYCIVPAARGACRSMPVTEAVITLARLSQTHAEIVLAGIDIGQYGADLGGGTHLTTLLSAILSNSEISRVRLSTLAPALVDDELISLLQSGRLCRHVHLSIQSCSDGVLGRMRRGYCAEDVRRAAMSLWKAVPDIAITGDVIAGFPGEDEAEHLETLKMLSELPLAGLHVFPFSRRAGTLAARMQDQLPAEVKRRRASEIREVAVAARRSYLN
ncbi:MAG: MiaB/RimO family radical SAM methylthiotransferase, partial [Planctomycetota bacterium]